MKAFLVLMSGLVFSTADAQLGAKADKITVPNAGGTPVTFTHCIATKIDADGVRVSHDAGYSKIPYQYLPEDWKKARTFDGVEAKEFTEQQVRQASAILSEAQEAIKQQKDDINSKNKQVSEEEIRGNPATERAALASSHLTKATPAKTTLPRIEPFGGFSWQDGLADVIQKINQMPGIHSIALEIPGYANATSLTFPADVNKLGEIMGKLLSKVESRMQADEGLRDIMVMNYFDGKGVKRSYIQCQSILTAGPILIAGVPFKFSARFTTVPGVSVVSPTKSVSALSYEFPLILAETSLFSDSPGLQDHVSEIDDLLATKYAVYEFNIDKSKPTDSLRHRAVGWLEGRDEQKGYIEISKTRERYEIRYRSEFETERLNEIYRKHVASLESQNLSKAPELKSGL